MIRRWLVEPDSELGIVTENQLAHELAKCAGIIDKLGGHLRVTTQRQRSEQIEGEAFTVGVIIEWVDRTDSSRVSPEPQAEPIRVPESVAVVEEPPTIAPEVAEAIRADVEDERAALARAAFDAEGDGVIVNGDGEPEEDATSFVSAGGSLS